MGKAMLSEFLQLVSCALWRPLKSNV